MADQKKTKLLDFSNIRGDAFGGITAGIVALPLALAFGLQSGLGATAGLYGAIFISFFAALFGGTNTQISGPTAPMTAVSMVVIAGILTSFEGKLELALPAILLVFMLAGLMQIGLGLLKVGGYISYIPYPVVSGFMTGIGVIILVTQFLPLMGYYAAEDEAFVQKQFPEAEELILERILKEEAQDGILVLESFEQTVSNAQKISREDIHKEAEVLAKRKASGVLGTFHVIEKAFKNINYIELILGILTLIIIYGFKRITKAIPSSLVALIVVTLVGYFFFPSYRTIGEIPSGFPTIQWDLFTNFNLGVLAPYIFTALSLAVLGAIDSLLTSVVADNMTKTRHLPNKELIGQGIGNTIAAIFGGIPGAGATIRTVVNIDAGGKTRLSGMIAGVFLLLILLLLSPLASVIPAAVLAGILVTVGIGVMDFKGLSHIKQLPKGEVAVMITVIVLTVFVGLIQAVAVGLILSSLIFMKNISDVVEDRTKLAPMEQFSEELPWEDEGILPSGLKDKVFIKHLDGPLFFGFATRFQEMLQALPDLKFVVIRMDKVPYVDQSGLYALEDAILDLQAQDVDVLFTDLHGQPQDMLEEFKLVPGLIPEEHCFKNFEECANWLNDHVK